jgi:hypothetical protein
MLINCIKIKGIQVLKEDIAGIIGLSCLIGKNEGG